MVSSIKICPGAIGAAMVPAIAVLFLAGYADALAKQPAEVSTLPSGADFAEAVTKGRINPETFDFDGAGYWRIPRQEHFLWQLPTIEAAQRVFTGTVDACTLESQRQGASMMWMLLLTDAADEKDWTANATALRARLAQLDSELATVKPESGSSDPRVAELLVRFARDQAVRAQYTERKWMEGLPPLAVKHWGLAFNSRWTAIDCANTAWLKAQLADIGWFDIPTYGAEADNAAWHLVQHADREPDFQRRMLAQLEALPRGHTDTKRLGFLWDRVAGADKRPQRYGTQGQCTEGVWKPFPVEDPERLDERRKSLGMKPMAEHVLIASRESCAK
jgi:hypothetical protein